MRVQAVSRVKKPLDNGVDPGWNSNYNTQQIAETFIRTSAAESAPGPEPGTWMLLGAGLVGMLGYG